MLSHRRIPLLSVTQTPAHPPYPWGWSSTAPTFQLGDPREGVQDPKVGVQDPKKGIEDPKVGVQDPKEGVQDPLVRTKWWSE